MLLLLLASRRRRWRLLIVRGVSLLLSSSSNSRCSPQSPVVFVGVSPLSLSCCCWRWRPSLWLIPSDSAPRRCCCRCHIFVVVDVYFSLASLAYPYHWRRLSFVVVFGFLLSSAASCCRCWNLVTVAVSSLSAEASLLVSDSIGFCALSLLLSSASRRRRRSLLVVGGVSFLSLSSDSCCHYLWRRLVVFGGGGATALSVNAYSILGLPCMQPPWSRNIKRIMVMLRYWVCGGWILSVRHPKK